MKAVGTISATQKGKSRWTSKEDLWLAQSPTCISNRNSYGYWWW